MLDLKCIGADEIGVLLFFFKLFYNDDSLKAEHVKLRNFVRGIILWCFDDGQWDIWTMMIESWC